MHTSGFTLYLQTPGILLGLILLMYGGTLLAIGLGAAGDVRSHFSTFVGTAMVFGAVIVQGIGPATAYLLLFAIAMLLVVVLPLALILVGTRGRLIGT